MIFKQLIVIFIVSSLSINQESPLFLHKEKYAMQHIQIGLLVVEHHRIQLKGGIERIQHPPPSSIKLLLCPQKHT